jgi:hypothetical protein
MDGLCTQVGTLREHLVWKVTKTVVLTESVGGSPADTTLNSQYVWPEMLLATPFTALP